MISTFFTIITAGFTNTLSVFVLDLARNGEMQSRITRLGSLSTDCARYYGAQIVDALEYMHSKGVIHRCVLIYHTAHVCS